MKPIRSAALAGAACLLVLSGCAPGGVATPTPSTPPLTSPSASPPPSPEPSPTPTATDVAEIEFDRFKEIYIGMSFVEGSAASGMPIEGEAMCPWYANIVADDATGFYLTALSPYETPGSEIWFFRMQWINSPMLASAYDMPRTPEGITIGSTEAELLAAYPTATSVSFDDYARGPRTQRLVAGPDDLTYVFDINAGLVTEITWGLRLTGGAQGEYCAL